MNSIARYDWLAEAFRLETGMMAPGKDAPAACGVEHTREERSAAWDKWLTDNRMLLRHLEMAHDRVLGESD